MHIFVNAENRDKASEIIKMWNSIWIVAIMFVKRINERRITKGINKGHVSGNEKTGDARKTYTHLIGEVLQKCRMPSTT